MTKVKKGLIRFGKTMLPPIIGILVGIIIGALIIMIRGVNPIEAYAALVKGAFGGIRNFSTSLVKAIPLGLTGLAVALSYRAGIFNIGAEGQLQFGAIATAVCCLYIPSIQGKAVPTIIVVVIASMIAGAALAWIPAVARAYGGYNEIVVTMLLNYIAIYFTNYLVNHPMKDPSAFGASTVRFDVEFPIILPGSYLHLGFVFFIVAAIFLWWLLFKSSYGFKVRAAGLNPNASNYAGINSKRIMITSMLISGALAGLGGACEVMGVHYRLMENFSPGYGYDAIAVALLANLHPLGVILSAIFFGALRNGAASMQVVTTLPVSFVKIIQGVSVLCVIAIGAFPAYIARMKRRAKK